MAGSSSSESQPFLTSSSLISGIIAYPPPIVKDPIFAKVMNMFQSETISAFDHGGYGFAGGPAVSSMRGRVEFAESGRNLQVSYIPGPDS